MSDHSNSPVLHSVIVGGLRLKNHIVMALMTRSCFDAAGVPPDYAADYYAQRFRKQWTPIERPSCG
ncbi:hypothetical protein [Tanticharoenia sakaeratensis]|uniref:hypothetical protein n=1 Tax=Tanticharoenia sakaeratensis TaxID=444053 RepID=UPI000A03C401|nr:hypothetical protein [Tanticharoenia sakaeratensis]GBQ23171.1 hypothetical protein AA103193_2317 [Tanticharoenia sakaeratensis NBRC 103193]